MLAKRISSLSLPNTAGAEQTLERGKIRLPPGSCMQALYCKVTVGITNTSGGSVTLNDAQKQALFALLQGSLNFGDDGHFEKVFDKNGADRIHREFRTDYASELELYSDATNGLAKPLPNSATTNVSFYLVMPTGKVWIQEGKTKEMIACGPTQALLTEAKVKVTSLQILANVVLGTNLTLDFYPDIVSSQWDKVSPVPRWGEQTDTDVVAKGPDGLYERIVERTNVHASSPFTNTTLKLGDRIIYDGIGSADFIVETNDAALLPAIGSTTDRETLLYMPTNGEKPWEKWPAGPFEFTQNGTQQLTTMLTGFRYTPIVSEADWARIAADIAKLKKSTIKLVSYASVAGIDVPDYLKPFVPAVVLTPDMKEYGAYAGLECENGGVAHYDIPPAVQERAKALKNAHAANKDDKLAADVSAKIAGQIPGAVQSTKGFNAGMSSALNFVRGFLGR